MHNYTINIAASSDYGFKANKGTRGNTTYVDIPFDDLSKSSFQSRQKYLNNNKIIYACLIGMITVVFIDAA